MERLRRGIDQAMRQVRAATEGRRSGKVNVTGRRNVVVAQGGDGETTSASATQSVRIRQDGDTTTTDEVETVVTPGSRKPHVGT